LVRCERPFTKPLQARLRFLHSVLLKNHLGKEEY
jgi:hypothetical protein